MKKKLVFLGAKEIGAFCFRYLLENKEALNLEIVALRSRKTAAGQPLLKLAEEYTVPILESLDEIPTCDFIYSVQHHELLRQKDIDKAQIIAVNLHLAPLPEYRGCNQFTFAILEDAPTFGVTIHQMDARIDHGAILFESRFPIPRNIWVKELVDLAVEKGKQLFVASLKKLVVGDYKLHPQSQFDDRRESKLYYRKQIQDVKHIPLDLSREEMEKRIRATMMPGFEPPFCVIDGQKVYFERK